MRELMGGKTHFSRWSFFILVFFLLLQTIEEFFCRDVTVVVTDAPDWKIKERVPENSTVTGASAQSAASAIKPVTPQSGSIFSPSPSAILNNAWSPLTPAAVHNANPEEVKPKNVSQKTRRPS